MIHPVLLCGGAGTRLWPLSRQSCPKQFAPLLGRESLFQSAARRLRGEGLAAPLLATAAGFRFLVERQLAAAGVAPGALILEPCARNTGPAVLAAALRLARADPDALMLVAPTDHAIPDGGRFRDAIARGAAAARDGRIVTFGLRPDRAETGYGWLELDEPGWREPVLDGDTGVRDLARFVEKPDPDAANRMLASGRHLWNAGVFLLSARTAVEAFARLAPEVAAPVTAAMAAAREDAGLIRPDPAAWSGAPDISVDRAVMERARGLAVVPLDLDWSDLGGWRAVWQAMPRDARGVAEGAGATAIDCRDTLLRSTDDSVELVGLGLEGIVAVATPDAVLVAHMDHVQDVGAAVETLKRRGAAQATEHQRDLRPWGWFETLTLGPRFRVKRITVHPGGRLSLQSHHHRAEYWIVVAGTAQVTVDDHLSQLGENQSIYVPRGARHRLENTGRIDLELIEVQTGGYLGEDDITRFDDVYARTDPPRAEAARPPAPVLVNGPATVVADIDAPLAAGAAPGAVPGDTPTLRPAVPAEAAE